MQDDDDAKSVSSTDILASSPLYFVLQRLLMTSKGTNVADELYGINKSLETIAQCMTLMTSKKFKRRRNKASPSPKEKEKEKDGEFKKMVAE